MVCINVLLNESNCKLIEFENYLEKKRHPKIYKSPLMYLYLCETVIIKKFIVKQLFLVDHDKKYIISFVEVDTSF